MHLLCFLTDSNDNTIANTAAQHLQIHGAARIN